MKHKLLFKAEGILFSPDNLRPLFTFNPFFSPLLFSFPSLCLPFPSFFLPLPAYTVLVPYSYTFDLLSFFESFSMCILTFIFIPKKIPYKYSFKLACLFFLSLWLLSLFLHVLFFTFPIFLPPPASSAVQSVRCISPFEVPYSGLFFSVHAPALRAVNASGSR